MITPKVKAALLAALNLAVLATSLAVPAARTHAQAPARAARLSGRQQRWSQGNDTRVRSFLDGFGGNVLTGKLEETTDADGRR